MARARRIYTPEFKAEAVKLVTEQGYSVAEAARSLGIHETLLRSWKQALQAQGDQAFPGHGKLPPFEEELRRLRTENQRLRHRQAGHSNALIRGLTVTLADFENIPHRHSLRPLLRHERGTWNAGLSQAGGRGGRVVGSGQGASWGYPATQFC